MSTQSVMGFGIDAFKERWGDSALEVVAFLIVGIGALGVVWMGVKIWERCTPSERAWVALALMLYGLGTLNARYPQERLHYLGYGLLGMMLYAGFARDHTTRRGDAASGLGATFLAATATVVTGSLVGLSDELLQILWPRRYFDWADAGMNVAAVTLGLLVAVPLWRAASRSAEVGGVAGR